MASVYKNLVVQLNAMGVKAPVGMSRDQAVHAVAQQALSKQVAQAFNAGIRPTLADWLDMPEIEQAVWQQFYEERSQADTALLALIHGNSGMAKIVMTKEGKEQATALQLGLQKAGL